MRKLVNMRLDVELLARVDSVCGSRGRTGFVERALEAALSEASGHDGSEQAGSVSGSPSGGVRPVAPSRGSGRVEGRIPPSPSKRVLAGSTPAPAISGVRPAREFVLSPAQQRLNKAKGL